VLYSTTIKSYTCNVFGKSVKLIQSAVVSLWDSISAEIFTTRDGELF